MANMHGTANCSSPPPPPAPTDLDDFSLFLHQIMLRSSSPSSSLTVQKDNDAVQSFRPTCRLQPDQHLRFHSASFPGSARIPLSEPCTGLDTATCVGFAFPGTFLPESAVNVSSFSINSADNELSEYDCESEEGLEGVVVEAPAKPTTARNASKRSRAAEVHNLSEKRRRSRINEKMKALQNLIPNSNKTDKASMLDEAIEYLKQLQLQVQLLTMRNGVNLHPMCLSGVLQPNEISSLMRMGYLEGNQSLNGNMARAIPLEQTNPTNILFKIPDRYPNQEQTSVANLRKPNDSDSFELETSSQIHPQSNQLPLPGFSKGICPEEKLPSELVKVELSRTNAAVYTACLQEGQIGGRAKSSVPLNEQASDLEACILGRDQSRRTLRNSDCETILASQFEG